ncbi:MAG: hypothetical protein HYX25_02830 [Candidatus Solibacter usitatus]|nr:hypothetical protein [Candidatus Solibacter usitatus]
MKGASGRAYLEKIVQLGFDIPAIERKRVHRMLFEGLDAQIADETVRKRFDQHRWGNIFVGGLQYYFETLRHVNRFLSTLSFQVSLFKGEGAFEVNPVDLIALEVLRTFEPEVYRILPLTKGALTALTDIGTGDREQPRAELLGIVQRVPEERRERVQEIIKQLFPSAEWAFGGARYGPDFGEGWFRDLRVCSEDVFDRYFHLALPEGDLAQAVIDRIVAAAGDRQRLRGEFEKLAREGKLDVAVDRLEAYKQQMPVEHASTFATALFDIGDQLSEEGGGFFEIPPARHANRIIFWYVKEHQDLAVRANALLNAIRTTDGLALPVSFVSLIESSSNKAGAEAYLTTEDLASLKQACLEKIRAAASDGRLVHSTRIGSILHRWREWGGEQEPKNYCAQIILDARGLLQLLKSFVLVTRIHGLSDHVVRTRSFMRIGDLEPFVTMEALEQEVRKLDESALSEEQKRVVSAFRKAAVRKRMGKKDDDPSSQDWD